MRNLSKSSAEGEATVYLSRLLSPCARSLVSRGLPAGGDAEYRRTPQRSRAFEDAGERLLQVAG